MKTYARLIAVSLCLAFLGGCAVAIPVKVATKTAKLGVKTVKTGVKATAAAAGAVIPDGSEKPEPEAD